MSRFYEVQGMDFPKQWPVVRILCDGSLRSDLFLVACLVARGEDVEQVPKYLPQRDFDSDVGRCAQTIQTRQARTRKEGTSQSQKRDNLISRLGTIEQETLNSTIPRKPLYSQPTDWNMSILIQFQPIPKKEKSRTEKKKKKKKYKKRQL
jgi:hypothetical protein